MASAPEKQFYEWILGNFPWFFQRIETSTASGVPDIWACHKGHSIWIETKAEPLSSVKLRSFQFAWIVRAHWNGIPVWVWNRPPRKKTLIQAWRSPFKTQPIGNDKVKIISDPQIALHKDKFAKLKIENFIYGK